MHPVVIVAYSAGNAAYSGSRLFCDMTLTSSPTFSCTSEGLLLGYRVRLMTSHIVVRVGHAYRMAMCELDIIGISYSIFADVVNPVGTYISP